MNVHSRLAGPSGFSQRRMQIAAAALDEPLHGLHADVLTRPMSSELPRKHSTLQITAFFVAFSEQPQSAPGILQHAPATGSTYRAPRQPQCGPGVVCVCVCACEQGPLLCVPGIHGSWVHVHFFLGVCRRSGSTRALHDRTCALRRVRVAPRVRPHHAHAPTPQEHAHAPRPPNNAPTRAPLPPAAAPPARRGARHACRVWTRPTPDRNEDWVKPSYIPAPQQQPLIQPREEPRPLYSPSAPEFKPAEMPDKQSEMPEGPKMPGAPPATLHLLPRPPAPGCEPWSPGRARARGWRARRGGQRASSWQK